MTLPHFLGWHSFKQITTSSVQMIQTIQKANLRFVFGIKVQMKQIQTLKKQANKPKKIGKKNNLVPNKIFVTKLLELRLNTIKKERKTFIGDKKKS